mmetsp:Transcript_43036/g.103063  ORF Transcript_43036/g.103063 Transcript_43036/m.103063 type:complete len:90 (-) Transcript_43036:1038-1307(-)
MMCPIALRAHREFHGKHSDCYHCGSITGSRSPMSSQAYQEQDGHHGSDKIGSCEAECANLQPTVGKPLLLFSRTVVLTLQAGFAATIFG